MAGSQPIIICKVFFIQNDNQSAFVYFALRKSEVASTLTLFNLDSFDLSERNMISKKLLSFFEGSPNSFFIICLDGVHKAFTKKLFLCNTRKVILLNQTNLLGTYRKKIIDSFFNETVCPICHNFRQIRVLRYQ